MIFNRSNVLLLALGLLAVLSPHPTAAASRKAGGRRTRSEDAAERRRLLEEREEAFAAANPYSIVDQDHRRAGSGSGTGSGHYGFYYPYSGSGTGSSTGGKGKGSSKCGYPDQRCCADPSHRCVPGYGCKFPVDFMNPQEDDYTCVKCGEDGGPCCNIGCGEDSCESSCLPGNTCNLFKNTCEKCGGEDPFDPVSPLPCCPGDVCNPSFSCDPIDKVCEKCGVEDGDPCCSDNSGDFCSNDSLACDKDTDTCKPCGGQNQICCPGEVCNLGTVPFPPQVCNTGTGKCEDCGDEVGALCCSGNVCSSEAPNRPPSMPGLSCNADSKRCQECGARGQTCCPVDQYEPQCVANSPCLDTGICEDLGDPDEQPDGCLLSNGNQDVVAEVPGDRGCNRYVAADFSSNLGDAIQANHDICCKGCCTQQQGKPDPNANGDGATFMWCVGNKPC